MTYQAQKYVAAQLDNAAARAAANGIDPATGKQCWFLAKLIVEFGEVHKGQAAHHGYLDLTSGAPGQAVGCLSKKNASFWIDEMLQKNAV